MLTDFLKDYQAHEWLARIGSQDVRAPVGYFPGCRDCQAMLTVYTTDKEKLLFF